MAQEELCSEAAGDRKGAGVSSCSHWYFKYTEVMLE